MISTFKKYTDFVFLTLLGLSMGISIYQHFNLGYILSINNYAAFVLWLIVLLCKIIIPKKSLFLVFFLMLLATIDIINFSFYTVNSKTYYTEEGMLYNGLGINIFFIVPLIVYAIINRKILNGLLLVIFKGSDEEQLAAKNKLSEFYYKKFAVSDDNEVKEFIKKLKDYPDEAQTALMRIKNERRSLK